MVTGFPQRRDWEYWDFDKDYRDAITLLSHTHVHLRVCLICISSVFCLETRFLAPYYGFYWYRSCSPASSLSNTHTPSPQCDPLGASGFGRWHFKGEWLFIGKLDSTVGKTHPHLHTDPQTGAQAGLRAFCHAIFSTEHEFCVHLVNKWGGELLLAAWIMGLR